MFLIMTLNFKINYKSVFKYNFDSFLLERRNMFTLYKRSMNFNCDKILLKINLYTLVDSEHPGLSAVFTTLSLSDDTCDDPYHS